MLLLDYYRPKHPKGTTEGIECIIVDTWDKFNDMMEYLMQFEEIAFDTEATGLDFYAIDKEEDGEIIPGWRLLGISFAAESNKAFYIPLGHILPECDWTADPPVQLPKTEVLDKLDPIWNEKKLIAHNLKFDYQALFTSGKQIKNLYFCTLIALYVINCSAELGLKANTAKLLGRSVTGIDKLAKSKNLEAVDIKLTSDYACADAVNCLDLYKLASKTFKEHPDIGAVFWHIEMPVLPIIAHMEMEGVSIDQEKVHVLGKKLTAAREKKTKEITDLLETIPYKGHGVSIEEFAPTHTRHIISILEDWFSIDLEVNRKTNQPKVDSKALNRIKLNPHHRKNKELTQFINLLLDWREIEKLRSTYTESLLENISPKDNKLHADWLQFGARTGRLASRKPNLMNQPSRSDDDFDVRSVYIVDNDDECFIACDYSALEMRIAGCLSNDKDLVDILLERKKLGDLGEYEGVVSKMKDDFGNPITLSNNDPIDIHVYTVFKLDKVPYNEIDKAYRKKYKPVGFGILYGITGIGLSDQLKCSIKEADEAIAGYLDTFPGIRVFIDGCKHFILHNGYLSTAYGRRCWVQDKGFDLIHVDKGDYIKYEYKLLDSYMLEKKGVLRSLVNARIQGTAADVMKMAMAKMQKVFDKHPEYCAKIVLQIHDEVVVKCEKKHRDKVANIILENMYTELKNDQGLIVPLMGEATAGMSLSKAEDNLLAGHKLWKPGGTNERH